MDILSLAQINHLSDRHLVSLFAEMTSDEMNRKYSYKCWLIPDECSACFASFGNEMKARNNMLEHLKKHLEALTKQEEDGLIRFLGEPVQKRKKRLQGESGKKSAKKKTAVKKPSPKRKGSAPKFTGLKSGKKSDTSDVDSSANLASSTSGNEEETDGNSDNPKETVASNDKKPKVAQKKYASHTSNPADIVEATAKAGKNSPEENQIEQSSLSSDNFNHNEQLVNDMLRQTQPYMDHCYTTVFGGKEGVADMYNQLSKVDSYEVTAECARTAALKCNHGNDEEVFVRPRTAPLEVVADAPISVTGSAIQIPVIRLSRMIGFSDAEQVQIESENQLISLSMIDVGNEDAKETGERPYPPMPKSDLARRGKMPLPESVYLSSGEEESSVVTSPKKKKRAVVEGSIEWEKHMAMKYIRELRSKRNELLGPDFTCKLCNDNKSFTAAATLMSHYRSHAGIKPYVCLICNTTFTRQHSLNYHMLIHNNQSRFTCKECGRKFRHPSHFKEHLRRHTGETPFQCPDCSMFFKTRNTYKRHLKTRHRKLLTAAGISPMEPDQESPQSRDSSVAGDYGDEYSSEVSGQYGESSPDPDSMDVSPEENSAVISPVQLTNAVFQAQQLVTQGMG